MQTNAQRFDPRQTMYRQNYEIFHYREPRPDLVEVHHHDFYEVYFFLGGKVEYWVEGRVFPLEPADLLLINPMELHRPILHSESSLYDRIVLWIDKTYLENLSAGRDITLNRCFDNSLPTHTNLIRLTSAQKQSITLRLEELVRESYSNEYGSSLMADGILLQFLVELNRIALQSDVDDAKSESSPLVVRVLSYINEHYQEELTLEGIASHFYVSKYHLSHEFRGAAGCGVYRYIILKRLLVARQMLMNGRAPVEVCADCGFRDYTNFYRAFKSEYGVSPRECLQHDGNESIDNE